MNKYIITVNTTWCGTEESFSAVANTEDELQFVAEELAYENFIQSGGRDLLLNDLFPNEEELTDEMLEAAYIASSECYEWNIVEYNPDIHIWGQYELVYDVTDTGHQPSRSDYRVYAGLGGGFGGAKYIATLINYTREEAETYAWECACEIYESYAGLHGLRDVIQIMDEEDLSEDEAFEIFQEERESWLDYFVKPISDFDNE